MGEQEDAAAGGPSMPPQTGRPGSLQRGAAAGSAIQALTGAGEAHGGADGVVDGHCGWWWLETQQGSNGRLGGDDQRAENGLVWEDRALSARSRPRPQQAVSGGLRAQTWHGG